MEKSSHPESVLKSVVWRILGVIILATLTYLYTRKWITTTYITVIHHSLFLIIFYLHERIWQKIEIYGRKRNIIKSIIYEIILGMGLGGFIVYIFTGSFKAITSITVTYTIIKLFLYFFYDRIWPEYSIETNDIIKNEEAI